MEQLANIPWGLIAPLLVLQLVLAAVAIIDIVRIHETRGPKWVWVIVLICEYTWTDCLTYFRAESQ